MGRIRLAATSPPGRIVGGFHIHEEGSGPAVVLEAGISATSLSWALVQPEVAKFARAIAYDRAGLGWSEPVSAPRTPSRIAAELHALLQSARIAPPYILVGHSFGGLVVERFAIDYPGEVTGLVLVDPLSPADFCPLGAPQKERLDRAVSLSRRGATLARMGVVRLCLSLVLGGNRVLPKLAARVSSGHGGQGFTQRIAGEIGKLPRATWPAIAWHWSLPKSFETMAAYLERLPESCAEMAGARLPSLPVTVLSAASNHAGPGIGLPDSARLIRAERSGHWVQLDQPELVIDAIREMLDSRPLPPGRVS